jgi:hypothetical protein
MSHLRTFYAGLFKQIPVGYFIKNNNFLQTTCDLAMMFSLLELSGGKAACIDEVLYMYNTTNGSSDCYTQSGEQIHNGYWVRARAPLQPLTENPAYLPKKNNAFQLYNWHISLHDLQSCRAYCTSLATGNIAPEGVQVWYTAEKPAQINAYAQLTSECGVLTTAVSPFDDCKTTMLSTLDMIPDESFILLTLDGCRWHAPVDWQAVMKIVSKTKALGYAATIGTEKSYNPTMAMEKLPTMALLHDQYYLWKPAEIQGTCHHPYALPALLISKKQLYHALTLINGTTISELLENLSYLAVENNDDVIVCSAQPSAHYEE